VKNGEADSFAALKDRLPGQEVRGSDWNELVTELDARWDFEHAIPAFAVQNEEK
jgi:hypothetical protein